MRKAVLFDEFANNCEYFNGETDVNNGYGCDHSKQDNKEDDENSKEQGCCHCYCCPLGISAEQEDKENCTIDWDGLCDEEVSEDEYLLVNIGEDATDEEKEAMSNYDKYMNRYN